MVSRFTQWTLDVQDVERMAAFWSAALGYRIERGADDVHLLPAQQGGLSVWLQPAAGPKTGKNRNHPSGTAEERACDSTLNLI